MKLNDTRWRSLAIVLATLLLPAALFAYRIALPVRYVDPQGGSRVFVVIPVLYLLALFAGLVVVFADKDTVRRVTHVRLAWIGFACLAADAAVYLLAGWSERSLKLAASLALPSLASLSCLAVGAFLWRRRPSALHGLVAISVIASAIAGVLQMAELSGFSTPPGVWMTTWDRVAAEWLVAAVNPTRAQGFEFNPNMFAPMAVLGLLWAMMVMPPGKLRIATIAGAVTIVITSQSRVALVIGLLLTILAAIQHAATTGSTIRRSTVAKIALAAVVVVVALVAARYGPLRVTGSGISAQPLEIEMPDTLVDESLQGRFAVWGSVAEGIVQNPWGVLQEYREYTAPLAHPHNEALYRLLYAGPLWLAVHAILLLWLALWIRPRSYPWIGVAFASTLFAQGLTEVLYTMHPYTVLLYLMVGAMMWQQAEEAPE